jgi:poly(hydroxyalkanoate) depolymerase family esterase
MKFDLSNAMGEIARLTRTQRLTEATRLIQMTLRGEELPASDGYAEIRGGERQTGEKPLRFRRPLAEVVNALLRAKRDLRAPPPKPRKEIIVPAGAQFLSGSFACPAGSRDYRLYIPHSCGGALRPVIVMLHGCKQDPIDFALGTRMNEVAEQHGLFVVYPAQPADANPMACWNWFNPKDQVRDSGEPAILAGMTRHIIDQHNVDPQRVFIAGLSAGGAMAAVMGALYPELYAGLGVHSGLPYQAATDIISAFAAMRGEANLHLGKACALRIPTIVFHGDADTTVHPSNADAIIRSHFQPGDCTQIETAADLSYTRNITRDVDGKVWIEHWLVHNGKHGWFGGSTDGSFTDPGGPDASQEMVRFFLEAVPGEVVA